MFDEAVGIFEKWRVMEMSDFLKCEAVMTSKKRQATEMSDL